MTEDESSPVSSDSDKGLSDWLLSDQWLVSGN